MTGINREAALASFDHALGKYPAAAEYLDGKRARERRSDALATDNPAPVESAVPSTEPIQI